MKDRRFFISGFCLFCLLAVHSLTTQIRAQEKNSHDRHKIVRDNDKGEAGEHQPRMHDLALSERHGEHLHHRPPVLPPDEDRAYSEFNHHIAGLFVLLAGGLAFFATLGTPRYSWARYAWPGVFFSLGVFLLVRHDPESWPWGPLSLRESVTDPQVLQHALFTFIVLGIGAIEWLRGCGTLTRPGWGLIFPTLSISAAGMLFLHTHGSGPAAEQVYLHHAIIASASIIAMIAKVLDDSRLLATRVNAYLWPALIMFIGLMLLLYRE